MNLVPHKLERMSPHTTHLDTAIRIAEVRASG